MLVRAEEAPFEGVLLKTPILHEGETLGELELWFNPDQIDRQLADRRQATLQLAALQVLLSMAVLIAVLYRRLLAPIQRLKRQASEIASRADVEPVRWDRRDELGQLGAHLNDVHQQIDTLFDQLETQKAELEKIALHDSLTGRPNRALFGHEIAVSASIGVAIYPDDATDPEALLRHADTAMYAAKKLGARASASSAPSSTPSCRPPSNWSANCARRWPRTSSSCTTSPRSTLAAVRCWAARR